MNRHELIALVGVTVVAWPWGKCLAQEPEVRIGYIGTSPENPLLGRAIYRSFVDELRALGFSEGRNLAIQAGGLMSYGADYVDMQRQLARYVAKILGGAKPRGPSR